MGIACKDFFTGTCIVMWDNAEPLPHRIFWDDGAGELQCGIWSLFLLINRMFYNRFLHKYIPNQIGENSQPSSCFRQRHGPLYGLKSRREDEAFPACWLSLDRLSLDSSQSKVLLLLPTHKGQKQFKRMWSCNSPKVQFLGDVLGYPQISISL